jgi:hypothetical protein
MYIVEKELSYHSPDEYHRTKVSSADQLRLMRGGELTPCIKVLFSIISIDHPTKEFMARKIYWPEDSIQLGRDLYEIVGDDIENIVGGNRQLDPDGLKMIIGKECDIEIVHIPSSGKHKFPYCLVAQVRAPGTLVDWPKDQKKAA